MVIISGETTECKGEEAILIKDKEEGDFNIIIIWIITKVPPKEFKKCHQKTITFNKKKTTVKYY